MDATPPSGSLHYKNRFDNSSFIKGLSKDVSDSSGSGNSCSPKETKRSNHHHHNHHSGGSGGHHHHHSGVHEMIKHLGKKVHIWPSRRRHESTSVITTTAAQETPFVNDPQENFRTRSKSLDVDASNRILSDCGATYKVYDKILSEGRHHSCCSSPCLILYSKFYLFWF